MVVLVFVVLWYVVKFCLRIFDKHREKEESTPISATGPEKLKSGCNPPKAENLSN